MESDNLIETLIFDKQFNKNQCKKEQVLIDIFKEQLENNTKNPNLRCMYDKAGFDTNYFNRLEDIPFIPVNMFKQFKLFSCDEEKIIRVLESSATTTGIPSKIYIDRQTSIRQTQALISTLRNFLGEKRRPVLIIDSEDINKNSSNLTARGAAVRGISNFASKIVYAMDKYEDTLNINLDRIKEFERIYGDEEVIIYGFTFIVWTEFLSRLKENNISFNFPKATLLHSGGWKKLEQKKVSKDEFSKSCSDILNMDYRDVLDFYGMVEQLGVIFIDCECGNKHVPDFAEIIIRDLNTLYEVKVGEIGLIEVMSTLSTSYPAQAILTEDIGIFMGVDDCKCGRKGKYFKFLSRVEKSEVRGCGDTFAEGKVGND
ncbi:hypothetical protein JOC70_001848 [Clostridium pascui]|uniref:LuxE/PaaK family acyltransferase n=1 Tax=Clostridium pascui TaxID=46609 RepID=UPI00195730EE|nr:acyl-protein synthetase [Clostridium pascui]MBM7870363.1 hypothetical protein [Clostridium pascui]